MQFRFAVATVVLALAASAAVGQNKTSSKKSDSTRPAGRAAASPARGKTTELGRRSGANSPAPPESASDGTALAATGAQPGGPQAGGGPAGSAPQQPATPTFRAPTGRIAVIDVVVVFNQYKRQQDLTAQMNETRGKLDEHNRQRLQQIDARQKEVEVLDPNDPAYLKKMRDVLQMQVEYKNWFDLKQAELTREVAVWTLRIYKEIVQVVELVAQQQGYDAVLFREEMPQPSADPEDVRARIRNRTVIYANPSIDVTQLVIDKLNADYGQTPAGPMLNVTVP